MQILPLNKPKNDGWDLLDDISIGSLPVDNLDITSDKVNAFVIMFYKISLK